MSGIQLLLAPFLGGLIGLALGMLGGGGSILTVPILVYVLGQNPHAAVATSLIIVGTNAIIGTAMHHRAGHVRVRQAVMFGMAGIVTAFVGARLSRLLSGPVLLTLFGLLMLLIAALMLRKRDLAAHAVRPVQWWKVIGGGMSVGFLTGFLGVGGGFLIVPALVLLLNMNMADAVGSSLLVIAFNSASGLLGHLGETALPWTLIGVFVGGGVAGLLVGSTLARRLSASRLRQSFAVFVVALALLLLAINLPILLAA